MANPVDSPRRWWGLFFLILAAGMLIWGQTLLKPHLRGFGFILYWAGCLLGTLLALLVALLDARATRARLRAEQRELIHRAIEALPETIASQPAAGRAANRTARPKDPRTGTSDPPTAPSQGAATRDPGHQH